AGVDPQRQDRVADVLHGRLAHGAGYPAHRAAGLAARRAGQRLQSGERVVRREHPAASLPASRGEGARPRRAYDHPPRLRGERRVRVLAAVLALALEAEEEISRAHLARVDDGALGSPHAPPDDDLGAGTGRDLLWRKLDQVVLAPSRRSSSLATSRSSNGIFRPPSNSWPCSWPLPAITTVSPGPAAASARAIAALRSGSTSTSRRPSACPGIP